MQYIIRKFNGTQYEEAQSMGEGDGSLTDIRWMAKSFFTGTNIRVSKRNGRVDIRGKGFEYGVFVEPHTHPDD